MNVRRHQRRAISPIVATVLIVAATLIAFAAVAGYVFGILGSGSATANVSVVSVSINHLMTAGTITVTNTGTAGTQISGVTLTFSGTTCSPTAGTALVNSGSTVSVSVTAVGGCAASTSSTPYTGYVSLSNGEEATFAGTFT